MRTGCRSAKSCAANSHFSLNSAAIYPTWSAPPPTETISPPAKRSRKAAKRRCEVELLREVDSEEELQLSPVDLNRQAPPIESPPSLMPLSTPAPSLSLADSKVGLPTTLPSPISTPATSLSPAGSPVGQLPSPHLLASSPTSPSPHTPPAQPEMPAEAPDRPPPTRVPAGPPPPPNLDRHFLD
jgi:hypothetical protein